ncbi:MAG TPA: transglutaminase domain-containing protein [Patescibacteria group bacterium]|nr:transglutaminase domain-containing protein [Patescibacteria group bacterium]
MKILKVLSGIVLAIIFAFLFIHQASAQGEFITDVNVEYRVLEGGGVTVTHNFTLENTVSNLYATSYRLVLDNIEPSDVKASKEGRALRVEQAKEGSKTILTVFFDDTVVGKGKLQIFSVSFNNSGFATRTGEVWEISIPRLSEDNSFRSYSLSLIIPTSLGNEAYMSPKPDSLKQEAGLNLYKFGKESVEKTGITAGFGAFQVFSFDLSYHLENPIGKKTTTEIALPPDTALQKVYFQEITPAPKNVSIDEDGNWIAAYELEPRERVDIRAKGSVQIFATVRPFPKPTKETLANDLKETQYWQTSNPVIKDTARRLQTAKQIYDFVAKTLSYDYERVRPNVERMGAVEALNSPKNAICMEFTDLFIALARSAGIPAREVNGFAYTENPQIQPLSLVADVLHSWPEYWSDESKSWIPIDPTWASTTGGVDYFTKLDLRHFTFVVHGKDPLKPYPPGSYKLGSNPQKDVFVNFGQLPEERISHPEITVVPQRGIPFFGSKLAVNIKNPGPVALYDLQPHIYFDNKLSSKTIIEVLPPYASTKIQVVVPFSFLAKDTPNLVKIVAADKEISVPTFKNQVIIYNLIIVFVVLAAVIIFVLIRLKKINLSIIGKRYRDLLLKIRNVKKDSIPKAPPPNN